MALVLGAARVVVAAVLIASALEKLRVRRAFLRALYDLGLTRVREWWLTVCALEVAAALAALAGPSWLAAPMVASLALLFAVAGLRAIRSGRMIECACFGTMTSGRLGRAQLLALPLWAVLAAGTAGWQPTTVNERSTLVAGAILLILAPRGWLLLRSTTRARRDRIATTGGRTEARARVSPDGRQFTGSGGF